MDFRTICVPTADRFVDAAVAWLRTVVLEAIDVDGICIIGLSGGSTPKPIYQKLGEVKDIDWNKVFVFLVDERYITHQHADSNTRMIKESLIAACQLPASNFITPNTELPLYDCIRDYEAKMGQLLSKSKGGSAHIVTLGLGDDGHFASLFPNPPEERFETALDTTRLVLHTTTTQFAVFDRISCTYKVICDAQKKVFFLRGANKFKVWNEMISSASDLKRWPAQKAVESGGTTLILSLL